MDCESKRSDGSTCRAHATSDGKCPFHSERYREARLAASARGGSKPSVILPAIDPLSPERARKLIASVSAALLDGSIDANTARSLAYVFQVDRQLRDSEALERRITDLESKIASAGRHQVQGSNGSRPTTETLQQKAERLGLRHAEER